MKKLFLIATLILGGIALQAQERAVGIRFGGGTFGGAEITYQQPMGEKNRLELDLGYSGNSWYTTINATGTYQWTFPLFDVEGLGWYAGPGASLGIWTYDSYSYSDNGFNLAIGGIVGIDYVFTGLPFQVSLDSRPMFNLIGYDGYNRNWGNALSVRYFF